MTVSREAIADLIREHVWTDMDGILVDVDKAADAILSLINSTRDGVLEEVEAAIKQAACIDDQGLFVRKEIIIKIVRALQSPHGADKAGGAEARRPTIEELDRILNSEDEGTPIKILPDGSIVKLDPEVEAVAWAILQALHQHVAEDKRPLAWSDMDQDQEARIRAAAVAAIKARIPSPTTSPEGVQAAALAMVNKHFAQCGLRTHTWNELRELTQIEALAQARAAITAYEAGR